jgi:hypothetical protein
MLVLSFIIAVGPGSMGLLVGVRGASPAACQVQATARPERVDMVAGEVTLPQVG